MFVFVAIMTAISSSGSATPKEPLKTTSKVRVGISEQQKWIVGLTETTVGERTTFRPIAYKAPKWRRARAKFRFFFVDKKTPETEAKTREKADKVRPIVDKQLAARNVLEAKPLPGGRTGRYRHFESGLSVYAKKDQILAHTGEIEVMKKVTLVQNVAKLIKGQCKRGVVESQIQNVYFVPAWKAVALYLQINCTPANPKKPAQQLKTIVVRDLSTILPQ